VLLSASGGISRNLKADT